MSTSGSDSGSGAAGTSDPNAHQAHVEPFIPFAEAVLSELQPLLAQIAKTTTSTLFTDLMKTMKQLEGLKDALGARVSEYDTGLQALKDGHHALIQKCKDREQQLSDLEITYKGKLEEETSLRSTIAQLHQDHSLIEPKLRNSRASLDWVREQEKKLNDSMKSVNDKRAQDDAELETKSASIQKEREEVDEKLASVAQKHREHNEKVAELEDLGRTTAQAVNQNKLELATLSGVMHTLRSSLNLLGSPSTLESIEDDAEGIAHHLQKKLESWKTQAGDHERALARKDKVVEKLTLQLKEARTTQRKLSEANDALTGTNNDLHITIDAKEMEMDQASINMSDLNDRVQLLEEQNAQTAESLSVVQQDLDDKLDAMASEKARADDLDKRNQALQSDLHEQKLELERLRGIELQARRSNEEIEKLGKELTFFQNQKPQADWEEEVFGLTEQIKSLSDDKGRADELDRCNNGLRVVLQKQVEDRMQLARQVNSHKEKAQQSASQIDELKQELMTFREQKSPANWEEEVLRLNEQVTGLNGDKTNLTTANHSLQTELDMSKSEIQKQESRIRELDAQVKSLAKENSAYKTENQKLQGEARKEKQALTDQLEEVGLDKKRLQNELRFFQQQKPVAQWEQELSALTSQVKVLNRDKQRLEDVRSQRNRLQKELNAFKQQKPAAQWEQELSELTSQVKVLSGDKQQLEDLRLERNRIQKELNVLKQQKPAAQWEQEFSELTSQVTALRGEKQRLEDVRSQRNRLQKELNVFKQQKPAAQWEQELSELTSQVTALRGEKQRSENLHASDQDKTARLGGQLNSLQTENGKLSDKIQGLELSKRNLEVLVDFLRELHAGVFGPMNEGLPMNTVMAQMGTYVQSQQDLNRMVELFHRDVAPTEPAVTAVAALQTLRADFSAQRNTVARLKSERKGLELAQGQKEKELKQELVSEKEGQRQTIRALEHRIQLLQDSRDEARAEKAALQDRADRQESELKEARLTYDKLSSPKNPGLDVEDHLETLQRQLEAAAGDRTAKEVAEKEAQRLERSLTSLKRELTDAKERLLLQSSTSGTLQDKVRRLEAELAKTQQQAVNGERDAQRMDGLEVSRGIAPKEAMASANDIIALRAQMKENDHQHRQAMAAANEGFQRQISSLKRQYFQLQSTSSTSVPEVAETPPRRPNESMSEAAKVPRRRTSVRSQTPGTLPRWADTDSHEHDDYFQGGLSDSEDERPILGSRKRKADTSNRRQGTSPSLSITDVSAGRSNLTGQPITPAGPASRSEVSIGEDLAANRSKRLRRDTAGAGTQGSASNSPASQLPASSTPASGGPVNEPPWNLDDVRQPGFRSSFVPARIVSEIQERIKVWDDKRPDWFKINLTKPKCVEQLVLRKQYLHNGKNACRECIKKGQICVRLANGTLEPLPLPPQLSGIASHDNVAFWKTVKP